MTYKYSDSMKKAIKKYNDERRSISIRVTEEEYNQYKEAAKKAGVPLRRFILDAIKEKISRQ